MIRSDPELMTNPEGDQRILRRARELAAARNSGLDQALAHIAGDYCVQTDWMAGEKTKRWLPAIIHGATYAACFLPITRNPRAIAVIGITHAIIDRTRPVKYLTWAKNQLGPAPSRYAWDEADPATGFKADRPAWLTGWLNIIVDNFIHMVINRCALRRWGR